MNKKEQLNINKKHEDAGVEFIDIDTVYIDSNVKIGSGTKLYPNVVLEGDTVIGKDCSIGMGSHVKDSWVGDCVSIDHSVIKDSRIGRGTSVGPFAYLRPGSDIGENCKIGDFVEVKNSTIGDGSKSSHLAYIGDSDLGKAVNVGCGVVFVNYDGKNKFRSTVEDGAFIGCNANIVSPVNIGEKAYIGAGTTVRKDIKSKSLTVEKGKTITKDKWVEETGLLEKK